MRSKNTDQPEPPTAEPAPAAAEISEISVVLLALELGENVDQLLARLGADVFVNENTSLRSVSVEVCRRTIDEHHAGVARRTAAMAAAAARIEAMRPPPRVYVADEHLETIAAAGFKGGQR